MTKRAARSVTTRRPAPKKRAPARRKQQQSGFDKMMAALPFEQATLHKIWTWAIVGGVGVAALGVASYFGVPGAIGHAAAEMVGEAGFRLENVTVYGLKRMDRNTVLAQAVDQQSQAMPLIDLDGVRQRLLQYPWIKDARVSRRLPNTMVINIVEREPVAIWQNQGQLVLIDAEGKQLELVSREAMPALPLLIGDGANFQEAARRKLLDSAPSLRPLVKAATWVGNRRWDLTFDTGEKLQLPEGEDDAAKALVKFAELDSNQRLLGRGSISFDMRDSERMAVRRPMASASPSPVPLLNTAGVTGNASEGE